jgi:putative membrane protein insertion efficiency factor
MPRWLESILAFPFLILVWIYRNVVSPFTTSSCRYAPSCSEYMVDAIKEWGPFKGIWLGLKRISSCHPWGGHGFDPVPKKKKKQ